MSIQIKFTKYQGTGNDFIMIDGRTNNIEHLTQPVIHKLCHRRFGIGADGLIILKNKDGFDFEMDYYNADGNRGSMCGNGGRCTIAYAYELGIIKRETSFYAPDGAHEAIFNSYNDILLKMTNVSTIISETEGFVMDTGSPHLVVFKDDILDLDIYTEGKALRYSNKFKTNGINVNFLSKDNDFINVATYERGVEDETYSCGTGTVAACLGAHINHKMESPIKAKTKGGDLVVHFNSMKNNQYENIWLQGPAVKSFEGFYKL